MAADERLLTEAARSGGPPVLRFYSWSPPAVSLGRFQDEASAVRRDSCSSRGVDIVRRVTGGRAVLHHRELTYSIVSCADNDLFPNNVIGTYRVIAQGLLSGLRLLGVPAELASRRHAPTQDAGRVPACFAAPSPYEVLVRGRKLVGSAQRRLPTAFLQHGSVLIEYDADLEAAVIPGGGADHSVTSLARELGRMVTLEEVKRAMLAGFADALQADFLLPSP